MAWILKKGRINFWHDIWFGGQPLADMFTPGDDGLLVEEFIINQRWDIQKLRQTVPMHIANEISKMPISQYEKDIPIWLHDAKGKFTLRSAWNMIRNAKAIKWSFRGIWSSNTPLKVSIFIWKLNNKFVSTDDNLMKKGFNIPSKCNCCNNPNQETMDHLFLHGEVAGTVWEYFETLFKIKKTSNAANILAYLEKWRCSTRTKLTSHVRFILPQIAIWEIWKQRTSARFEEDRMSAALVISQTLQTIRYISIKKPFKKNEVSGDMDIMEHLDIAYRH